MHALFQVKKGLLPLLIVFCLILTTLFLLLLFPYFFNQQISQRILSSIFYTESELHLSRITPWQTTGSLRIGDESSPLLIMPRFTLHYSPSGLFEKKINQLHINSASIHLHKKNGQLQLPEFKSKPSEATHEKPAPITTLPFALNSLHITNSLITIYEGDDSSQTFFINANINLSHTKNNLGEIIFSQLTANTQISGSLNAEVQVETYPDSDNLIVEITGKIPLLDQLNELLPTTKKFPMGGAMSFNSTLTLSSSLDLLEIGLSGFLSRFEMRASDFTFHSNSGASSVNFSGSGDLQQFDLHINGLDFSGPQNGHIDIETTLHLMEKIVTSNTQLFFNDFNNKASLGISADWNDAPWQITYQLNAEPFTFNKRFVLDAITLSGKADVSEQGFTTHLHGHVEKLSDKITSLSLHKISLDLPLQFPLTDSISEQGYLNIESVKYKEKESGNVRAEFTQTADRHNFKAQFSNIFQQELSVNCRGELTQHTNLTGECKLPVINLNSEELSDYFSLPEGLTVEGNMQADALFSISPNNITGKLHQIFSDGVVTYGKNKLSGIDLSIDLPNLPKLQSKPNQAAHIKKIEAGDIHLSDATLNFQIEEEFSLFLEKAVATWCNGKIETSGIRVYKEMDSLIATFYADRLGFSELMSQLGIENTEGEGSLNGKIPLHFNEQGLTFNDGFLFSTPGNTGIIKFHDTNQLRQGVPSLDQAGYLEYSMKALEDFSYNWTKLTFNNQDEDLLITMQLDGKPTSPLPFSFNNGRIVGTKKGSGLQHPIRLDVNIRLPLQELLKYGDNLQSIMENM